MDQLLAYLARYFFPWAEQPKNGFLSRFFAGRSRILGPAKPRKVKTPEPTAT